MRVTTKQFTIQVPSFALHHGGQSGDVFVRCSLFGSIDLPIVAVLGGISANHLVTDDPQTSEQGWWRDVANKQTFLNGRQVAVLSFEYITLKDECFQLSTHDQAHVLAGIHQQLNIPAFLSVVGCSYGGMVAQAFTSAYPYLTHSLINLVAAHKNSIRSQALRLIQRQIMSLALDPLANSQHTACARALAIMTYRGIEEFDQRFDNLEQAQSYLNHNGQSFAAKFSSKRYAQLSASIDTHEIEPSSIIKPTLIIATDSDQLVPVSLVKTFASQISAPCECHIIPSAFGHDGFLKEHHAIEPKLAHFLSELIRSNHMTQQTPTIGTQQSSTQNAKVQRSRPQKSQTLSVRAGIDTDTQHGAVTPALYLSSNYSFADFNQPRKYDYSRSGNPTRDLLAEALADLEEAAGGVVTATGMAAVTLVTQLVPQGGLVIAPHDCYGGTFRLLNTLHEKGIIEVAFIDQSDTEKVRAALTRGADLLWIETPSNPLLRVVDVQSLCDLAGKKVLKVVDNTFLSPALQQPLNLGADLVIHSTTKYINGHSDVVGGAVLAKTPELAERVQWWANCIGITAAPFDCLLTLRGLRTLHVRLQQHVANTEAVLETLQAHPAVGQIYYPGLEDHPGHEIAKKQQKGFGAMLSFELNGEEAEVRQLLKQLELFTLAESLGGVESLVCHPATMTHAAMTPVAQVKAGISQQLIRLSVGIEHTDDLLADLSQALDSCISEGSNTRCLTSAFNTKHKQQSHG